MALSRWEAHTSVLRCTKYQLKYHSFFSRVFPEEHSQKYRSMSFWRSRRQLTIRNHITLRLLQKKWQYFLVWYRDVRWICHAYMWVLRWCLAGIRLLHGAACRWLRLGNQRESLRLEIPLLDRCLILRRKLHKTWRYWDGQGRNATWSPAQIDPPFWTPSPLPSRSSLSQL